MKLNKWQKQGIIQAIKDDIPTPDDEVVHIEVQAAFVAAMSPEVRKLYNLKPNALREEHLRPGASGCKYSPFIVGDVNTDDVIKPWVEAGEKRYAAIQGVCRVVEGCSTLKQLQAALPECVKYMPTEDAPSKNLPALANVVADLVHLGWPKPKAA